MDTHFVQTPNPALLIERMVTAINDALSAGTSVAWFLSGGSAIAIAVETAKRITEGEPRKQLRILQIDERYGPVGHPDSNWQKLMDSGFRCEGAVYRPILHDLSFPETVSSYDETLQDVLNNGGLRVGLLGIGPDGHTAGMLPGSTAANETEKLAVGYQGPDFTRITMTTPAMAQLDLALVFAGGEDKRPTLQKLEGDAPLSVQPAQAIKKAAQWYIYSDVLAAN
jgi:6-phosphogluconolactonase/glucosamine-6-phosphate isomerase/deaminase